MTCSAVQLVRDNQIGSDEQHDLRQRWATVMPRRGAFPPRQREARTTETHPRGKSAAAGPDDQDEAA